MGGRGCKNQKNHSVRLKTKTTKRGSKAGSKSKTQTTHKNREALLLGGEIMNVLMKELSTRGVGTQGRKVNVTQVNL